MWTIANITIHPTCARWPWRYRLRTFILSAMLSLRPHVSKGNLGKMLLCYEYELSIHIFLELHCECCSSPQEPGELADIGQGLVNRVIYLP